MLISFIIPVYNCEKYLSSCIESILSVQLKGIDYEILLIDDGSTDGTWAKVQGMKDLCDRRFTRVLFI